MATSGDRRDARDLRRVMGGDQGYASQVQAHEAQELSSAPYALSYCVRYAA